MFTVFPPKEAREAIARQFGAHVPCIQNLPLLECLGRRLAQDICADCDVPGFNRSMIDGYAVIAADTFGASQALPAMLEQVGTVRMGERPTFALQPGQCAYIPTGGELPQGSDATVMVEYTSKLNDTIFMEKATPPGGHVAFRGDDVQQGQLVLKKGRVLRPQEIGSLAALGVAQVPVYCPVKVGVISTGDELVDIQTPLTGSVVRDVNTYAIGAGLAQAGASPVLYGIVKDDWNSLKAAMDKALAECEVVLISGGSSVGTADMTAKIIDAAGAPGTFIHGLAVKPGKPTIVGDVNGKPVFGLPGHPVSAYFVFRMFVLPLLALWMGGEVPEYTVSARMAGNVPSGHGREEYLPVWLECQGEEVLAHAVQYKSGLITALSQAEGYVCIQRDQEGLRQDEAVQVTLF